MIEKIEESILDVLRENFEDYDVLEFPPKFEEFYFTQANGCILVRFEGSQFSEQTTVTKVEQEETYKYSIVLGLRSRQSFKECYPTLRRVRTLLKDMSIYGRRIQLEKQAYLENINGDLWWGIGIKVTLPDY